MSNQALTSLEVFTGAGGLALAARRAGFKHQHLVEWNSDCCDTINFNISRGMDLVRDWPSLHPTDVQTVDFKKWEEKIDLLAGGPPCQPFSLGGKHRAFLDKRDMFPQAVRAIRESRPKVAVLENVKGLLRSSYATYLEYIVLQMTYPSLQAKDGEDMTSHLSRLEQHHTSGAKPEYRVIFQCLNAADYGVPQKRERVFFVAFREDYHCNWSFQSHAAPTHSIDSLLFDKWISGEYWEKHKIKKPSELPPQIKTRIARLKKQDNFFKLEPWVTVRDAICDLPDPRSGENDLALKGHIFQDGARTYPGHTGSPLDEPSKTIKAGVHGVPGGENMIRFDDGSVRYFTVRETARIQTFPDNYEFKGSWSEVMKQLGNAVPVDLGNRVLASISNSLRSTN